MKYLLHPAASGRPSRFVYREAAKAGVYDFEVTTHGRGNLVAGAHLIWQETGYSLGGGAVDTEIRGSILPDRYGNWVVATADPRTPLSGPTKWGYKSQTELQPLTRVDIIRAKNAVPKVPEVRVRKPEEVLAEFRQSPRDYVVIDIEGTTEDMHILGVGWDSEVAWVMAWDREPCLALLRAIIESGTTLVFHNANYDVTELTGLGLPMPEKFEDTIVLAAMFNPSLKKGLQPQVLSWVDGSTAWKGLVDHKRGYQYAPERAKPGQYRALWAEIMRRLGRNAPVTPWQWYAFYNGLDVAYTFRLHSQLRVFLTDTGQLPRYEALEKRLHPHLIKMGLTGMPVNTKTRASLVKECKRIESEANAVLTARGEEVLRQEYEKWQQTTDILRQEILAAGGKLGDHKEYTSARSKAAIRKKNLDKGFNFDSPSQRAALIYDHLGLPKVGRNGRSTQEDVLTTLRLRLSRTGVDGKPAPSCKPKVGTIEEAVAILDALITGKQYATWRRNFLSSKLVKQHGSRRPRMQTEYHLHRAKSNRLSSGTSTDDADKKEKKQQLQNVPKPLRRPVEADPGFRLVGGDWSNVEWAVVQVLAMRVPDVVNERLGIPKGFHRKLLDRFQARELDAHCYLASVVEGIPEAEITPPQRQNCKSYTHGRNFLGTEYALAAAAGHTIAQAQKVCRAHHKAFRPDGWWEVTETFVREHGYVECAYGWRRYFEEEEFKMTEVLGTQVQGSAAELCKYVLLDIFETLKPGWEVLTSTHDSILMQVPETDETAAINWLKAKMEQPISFLDDTWFPADVGSGQTWKEVG